VTRNYLLLTLEILSYGRFGLLQRVAACCGPPAVGLIKRLERHFALSPDFAAFVDESLGAVWAMADRAIAAQLEGSVVDVLS
jgi:hypothetical protein